MQDLEDAIETGDCLRVGYKDIHVVHCQLHVAAPELLAGLKDALDYIRTYCGRAHGIDLKKWDSVIAKATDTTH